MSIEHIVKDILDIRRNVIPKILPTFGYRGLINGKMIKEEITKYVLTKDIIVTRDIPEAGFTENEEILINPDWWMKLGDNVEVKTFILLHEVFHIEFLHHKKTLDQPIVESMLWNIAIDAVVNNVLFKLLDTTKINDKAFVTPRDAYNLFTILDPELGLKYKLEDFNVMNENQIYTLLYKAYRRCVSQSKKEAESIETKIKCIVEKTLEKGRRFNVVNVEDKVKKEVEGGKYPYETARRNIAIIYIRETLRSINRLDNEAKIFLENIRMRESVYWKNHLLSLVTKITSGDVVHTFLRPSRRHEDLPRYVIRPSIAKAIIALDVSGSVDERTLKCFLEETLWVRDVVRNALNGFFILWDDDVRSVIPISDLKINDVEITGRVGLTIDPLLRYIDSFVQRVGEMDILVILTDGMLDLNDRSLSRVLLMFKYPTILYTASEPKFFHNWPKLLYSCGF